MLHSATSEVLISPFKWPAWTKYQFQFQTAGGESLISQVSVPCPINCGQGGWWPYTNPKSGRGLSEEGNGFKKFLLASVFFFFLNRSIYTKYRGESKSNNKQTKNYWTQKNTARSIGTGKVVNNITNETKKGTDSLFLCAEIRMLTHEREK